MTTLVYDHTKKHIAYDSRSTAGHIITSDNANKLYEFNGTQYLASGAHFDIQQLAECYFTHKKPEQPYYDATLLVIQGKDVLRVGCENSLVWWETLTHSWASGSGSEFALAALDFGRTAFEAVEYAKTRDSGTGGDTHVLELS